MSDDADKLAAEAAKPIVDETQGTGPRPCNPLAIHDVYPPIGTPENLARSAAQKKEQA